VTGAASPVVNRYLFVLVLTVLAALAVKNLARSSYGRSWMAIRDMDIAAPRSSASARPSPNSPPLLSARF